METIKVRYHHTPAGSLIIGSIADKLCVCDWTDSKRRAANDRRIRRYLGAVYDEASSEVTERAVTQLDEYFAGSLHDFSIPILYTGTPFQYSVWSALTHIPYGTTVTYAEIARRIGQPGAVRAVASAIAANPMSIFVPCHRVIGAGSALTGYAGGLHAKQMLLDMEAGRSLRFS